MHPRLLLPFALFSIVLSARGQFYAPDTEFHDIAQRAFPVEAARVLAWQRIAGGQPPVAEVTYEVSTTPSRETVWKIRWLDAAKKPVREKEVRYAEAQLVAGANYFRSVVSQLEGEDWKIGAGSPDNAATTFWQGAELSGGMRLDAIKAASTLVKEKPKMARAADAARMAGILSHATFPQFDRQVSLDPVLLGRAAAWLCIAESRSHEKFNASWVPILFLSGREKQAAELSGKALWRPAEKQSAGERFWRMLTSQPTAKDMFLFGARPENRSFAVPVVSYVASLDALPASALGDAVENVAGGALSSRTSEYSSIPVKEAGESSAADREVSLHEFLEKWRKAVADFQPSDLDYKGYQDVAKAEQPVAGSETTLSMLKRFAPMLNLGLDQGTGPFCPTAHVTSRDLLGFGWEVTGVLASQYHEALSAPGGNLESAKSVLSATVDSIKDTNVFFGAADGKAPAPSNFERVQHVSSARVQETLLKNPPANWKASPEGPLKRQWLNRIAMREGLAWMADSKAPDDSLKEIVERLIREGGRAIVLDLSRKEPAPKYAVAIDRFGLRETLTAAVPVLGEVDLEQLKTEIKALPSAPVAVASTPGHPTEVVEKLDLSKFKTAEEFWAALEKLREMPGRAANSPEDRMRQIRAWLDQRKAAADAFLKAYPNDPHRYDAKLIAVDSMLQLVSFGDEAIAKLDGNELDEIINAPDANETTKGEAEFFKLMVVSRDVSYSSPHTLPPFQQSLVTFLEKYPKHERSQYVGAMLMQTLSTVETPSTEPLLKKLTKNPNERIAAQAQSVLQQRKFMLELKKKPLDLKFTATDGTQVDAAKLRGKVVLLDFWASWCGPCMADAPHVVAVYNKLRERGFEIIGISLDQDKAAMESALKSAGMTWPQHFDGKGWQSELGQRFGVRSIPSTWLFDKQGKLREHGLRGKELEARIENLLKEK